jgi:lipopolysaccharide/colanic/teichoic acid biosynthesis glycosyltransferase
MQNFSVLATMAMALLVAPLAQAAIYKWIDADGNVIYSQTKPPASSEAQTIEKHSTGTSDKEAQGQLESLRNKVKFHEEDRDIRNDIAKQQTDRSSTIKKNCEIARNNKSLLQTTARVTVKDEDGNDYFLADADRAGKVADAEAQIDRYCD